MAAPQPDFQILSNSLIVAGQHVSLLPNLPAINYERFLHEQFATLQERIAEQFRLQRVELDTRFDQIDTRFAQIDTRFAQIDTRFAQIDTRFDQFNMRFMALELSTKAEATNHAARVFNSHITSLDTKLHALYNQPNEAVEGFPEDLAVLTRLNDVSITALLHAYDLATDGTVTMKRRRFRYFIGAVINA